ncbi:DUF1461 domain-containing protein, partial [Candidatus Woesearchaeota archaeon]|nr:DUF1461 domain-containing protein [Candidatus Woesearchaeota archaeon]
MHKKKFSKSLVVISVIPVFLILFFSTMFSIIYNLNFYEKNFQQYKIYDRFTKQEALDAAKNIMGFFKSKNELDSEFFNENEVSHLLDVKLLLQKAQQLYYVSISIFWVILIGYYLGNRKDFMRFFYDLMFFSGIFTVSIILICGFLYLVSGFDFLFIKFHELFFTGNYSFNPTVSNMKALFP